MFGSRTTPRFKILTLELITTSLGRARFLE
jgi:hypothetical protein